MQNIRNQQKKTEVDLFAIFGLLFQRKWNILLSGIVGAAVMMGIAVLLVEPRYSSSVTMYANNSTSSDNSTSISAQDINASVQLVDTYAAIILSDPVLDQVIRENHLELTGKELQELIEVKSVNNTEIFQITVEYGSAEKAADIANSISAIAPGVIGNIVEGCSVKIVSPAKTPIEKSFPSYKMSLIFGLVAGVFVSILVIFFTSVLDTRIKGEKDLEYLDYPILGSIPSFANVQRGQGNIYGKKGEV